VSGGGIPGMRYGKNVFFYFYNIIITFFSPSLAQTDGYTQKKVLYFSRHVRQHVIWRFVEG
jgi:hypothetical protein